MKKRFLTYLIVGICMSCQVHAKNYYYWTATGNANPLPIDSQMVTIPRDAVAVDLRGIHASDILYQLNTDSAQANCLYYVDEEDVVEGLPSTNVVRNLIAEELFINDDGGFFCPIPFTAEFAVLRITLRRDVPDTPTFSMPYYDTLILPFDMDDAMPDEVNGIMPDGWLVAGEFVGDEDDLLYFDETDATALKANTPYLVEYRDVAYGSHVLFYGENKQIEKTGIIKKEGKEYSFTGVTFSLSSYREHFQYFRSYEPYFSLVEANTMLEPFKCFIECITSGTSVGEEYQSTGGTDAKRLDYLFEDGGTPSITGLSRHKIVNESTRPTIYSLSGQPLQRWQKGINVVKGKKIFIK